MHLVRSLAARLTTDWRALALVALGATVLATCSTSYDDGWDAKEASISDATAMPNAGFEGMWALWDHTGASEISTSVFRSGVVAAMITGPDGRFERSVRVSASTTYYLSAFVSGQGEFGASWDELGPGETSVAKATVWSRGWTRGVVEFSTATATVVTIYGAYGGDTGYFDDFAITTEPPSGEDEPSQPTHDFDAVDVVGVAASGHDGHEPENTLDGDFYPESRWSAEGNGVWIRYDLGSEQWVEALLIAWYKGDDRQSLFKVQIGSTPEALVTIFDGRTTGETVAFEAVPIGVKTRYVQIVGHGNTQNGWTSIVEVLIAASSTTDSSTTSDSDDPPEDDPSDLRAPLPMQTVDLSHWKLQIPGPTDISTAELVDGYSSEYFEVKPSGEMVFWVDSAELGSTPNSNYVRSELREALDPTSSCVNWPIEGTHTMAAKLRVVDTGSSPDRIVLLQIHGKTASCESAPPLLELVLDSGALRALIKGDNAGETENSYFLTWVSGEEYFDVEIIVAGGRLKIYAGRKLSADVDVSFWTHENYFKAGAYPQAQEGISEVWFGHLSVSHDP